MMQTMHVMTVRESLILLPVTAPHFKLAFPLTYFLSQKKSGVASCLTCHV